jgi:hypothetical protein
VKTKRKVMIAVVVLAMFLIAGQVLAASYNFNIPALGYAVTPNEAKTGNCNWGYVGVSSFSPSDRVVTVKFEDSSNNQIGTYQFAGPGSVLVFPDSSPCGVGQLRHFAFDNVY